ncbi:MAG: glycosyltransferase family 4 protein [Candidatus Acidiferrales bacterium]
MEPNAQSLSAFQGGILFVGNDATRTGAPIALLHFLRWFKTHSNLPFSILLGEGGDLTADFEELADTWSTDRSRWCPGGTRVTYLSRAGFGWWARRGEIRDVQRFAPSASPALVYVNSIVSARTVEMLAPRAPILTHVHELDSSFQLVAPPLLSRLIAQTRRFIACSNAVRENLIRAHGARPEAVETIYESIPIAQVRPQRTCREVLRELRIPADALLVMACGTLNQRKGADLFLQLAAAVCRQREEVYFAWIGGGLPAEVAQFENGIRAAGLAEKVRLTGTVPHTADYLAAADVFVLTSREDPYPLVCLEAASLAKPIVCFADAGGMPEFVERDCGFIVPYLDIVAMGDRVVCLLDSPDSRLTMGAAARRKVAQRHDVSATAPRIMEIIERTIAAG